MMNTPSPPITPNNRSYQQQQQQQQQPPNRRFVPANNNQQLMPNNNGMVPSKFVFEDIITSQGTLKRDILRNDETVQAVRQENIMLAEKVQHATNLYRQLLGRLTKTEERMELENKSMSHVISQAKQIEVQLINQQENLSNRENQLMMQVTKLQEEVSIMKTERDQSRKTQSQMSHDLRQLQEKITRQSGTLSNGLQDLKSHLDQKDVEKSQSISIALNDLRERMENQEHSRTMFQTQMEGSFETLKMKVEQVDKQRQEDLYNMSTLAREKEALAKADIRRLQEKFRDSFDEFNKNLSGKDGRLRTDLEGRVQELESRLNSQKKTTNQKVQELEEEAEQKIRELKESMQMELDNFKGSNNKVDDENIEVILKQMKSVEKQVNANKKEIEKVVRAEISSRLTQGEKITHSMTQMQKEHGDELNLLQSVIAENKRKHEQQIAEQKNDVSRLHASLKEEIKSVYNPKRIDEMEKKIDEIEDALDEFTKMDDRLELNSERIKQIEMENILAFGDLSNTIETNTKRINHVDKSLRQSIEAEKGTPQGVDVKNQLEESQEDLKRPSAEFKLFKTQTEDKFEKQQQIPSQISLIERKLRVLGESLEEIKREQAKTPKPVSQDGKTAEEIESILSSLNIMVSVMKTKIVDEWKKEKGTSQDVDVKYQNKKDELLTVLKARLEELEKAMGKEIDDDEDDDEDDEDEEEEEEDEEEDEEDEENADEGKNEDGSEDEDEEEDEDAENDVEDDNEDEENEDEDEDEDEDEEEEDEEDEEEDEEDEEEAKPPPKKNQPNKNKIRKI